MDLFNLKKSKLRREILELYFAHPEKKYYLRELERRLKKPVAYIRRELLNLQKSGLFISEYQGRERFFSLNQKFPLYKETEKIVSKTIGIEAEIEKQLGNVDKIKFAFIFGSYVKGDFGANSDIDLYVIGDTNEDEVYRAIKKVEEKIRREINYHLASSEEFKKNLTKSFFHKEILHNYLLIRGDENEFRQFIKST